MKWTGFWGRDDRARAQAWARVLVKRYGPSAYYVARDRARQGQTALRRDPHWSAVAVEIAAARGLTIGLMTRDRWRE